MYTREPNLQLHIKKYNNVIIIEINIINKYVQNKINICKLNKQLQLSNANLIILCLHISNFFLCN